MAGRAVGEVFRDTLQSGGEGPAVAMLPAGRFGMGIWTAVVVPMGHFLDAATARSMTRGPRNARRRK